MRLKQVRCATRPEDGRYCTMAAVWQWPEDFAAAPIAIEIDRAAAGAVASAPARLVSARRSLR